MAVEVRELTENDYPRWDALLATSPQRSIFNERWWMEIVTGGTLRLLGAYIGGTMQAGLPLWPCRTLGVPRLRQPVLTPYWGPLFAPMSGKYYTQLSQEIAILRAFSQALLPWPDATLQFHPSLQNWMPFHWQGYTQTTRYTYRLAYGDDPLEGRLHADIKYTLKRLPQYGLQAHEDVEPEVVTDMYRKTMGRQGLRGTEALLHLWPLLAREARDRNRMRALSVTDGEGRVHAAAAIVWDDRCAYYLMSGGDPELRQAGGGTLAQLRAIELAAQFADTFDFEGSMLEPVEFFFRKFGGELHPYLLVTRAASGRLNAVRAAQSALRQGGTWLRALRQPRQRLAGDGVA